MKKESVKESFPKKGFIKRIAEYLFEIECSLTRIWAASAHQRLMKAQWGLAPAP